MEPQNSLHTDPIQYIRSNGNFKSDINYQTTGKHRLNIYNMTNTNINIHITSKQLMYLTSKCTIIMFYCTSGPGFYIKGSQVIDKMIAQITYFQ